MKVINFVSGKGGTGKTLIAAVLAELLTSRRTARVLLIDLDIFVRGLTTLLYFQGDRRTRLLTEQQCSIAEVLAGEDRPAGIGIVRYRGFDVWPAVQRVDQKLKARDVVPDTFDIALARLTSMLNRIPQNEYDLVFLDSRAGFDELTAATYAISDVTINVEEDDLVSEITSDNLVAQFADVKDKAIYRIINKSRGRHRERIAELGRIPFDADIMESYGEEDFWTNIKRSMIESSLVTIWNRLGRSEGIEFNLVSYRSSPFPIGRLESRFGGLTSIQRLMGLYGLLLSIGGFAIAIGGKSLTQALLGDPLRSSGAAIGLIGIALGFFAMGNRYFKGK